VALILEDGGRYKEAMEELRELIKGYESQFGQDELCTLTAKERLALIYRKSKQWERAKQLLEQVIQSRIRLQGPHHPDTTSGRATLASTYRDQGDVSGEKLNLIATILERREDNIRMTENEVVKIATSFDKEIMKFLLDQRGGELQIPEAVVAAAAGNCREVTRQLTSVSIANKRRPAQRVSQGVLFQAALPHPHDRNVKRLRNRAG